MTSLQMAATIIIVINVQINGQSQRKIKSNCGRRLVNHEAFITNGFESNEGDWPWHAAIFHVNTNQDISYKCGGTVLNSNSILTAAHCVYENNRPIIPERVLVQLGKHDLRISGPNIQELEVYKVIPHPNYNTADLSNDIAILRLSTEATLNNYVQPICLWNANKAPISEVTGRLGTVIGWGVTENDEISYIPREAVMPVVSLTTCLESNRDFFGIFLSDKTFCAGFQNGTSVCNGDSGGSITFEEKGVYSIRGIVSLTVSRQDNQLCDSKEYVVFADVAKYLLWIEEVVLQLQLSPSLSPSKLGEQCSTRTYQPGVCTSIHECPSILCDLKQGKRNHVICGYEESEQFVCCPSTQVVNTTTARISVRKCNEYKEFAYDNVNVSNVFKAVKKKESNCAFTYDPLTVGITTAKQREFPHAVLIGSRLTYFSLKIIVWYCGGSLISERFVLSSVSCRYPARETGSAEYVRLGEHEVSKADDAQHIDVNIIEIITHPEYRQGMLYNDIVLFKLKSMVQFSSAIRPACLPEQSVVSAENAIASGWPVLLDWRGEENPCVVCTNKSSILLKVVFDIFSHAECNNSSYITQIGPFNEGIVEESQLCAGSHEKEIDLCNTTPGMPLQIYHERHFCTYTIVGVTSFGKECLTVGTPDVYTRVYAYIDWIESVVWPNE